MAQIFGDFVEIEEESGEYLKISFHPASAPLQQRWRNNGLSADFLADYLSTFFPGDDPTSTDRQTEIKDAISFIANELLENAMKFSYASSNPTVSIEMILKPENISLYTINSIDPGSIQPFQKLIQRIFAGDPNELYLEQLERNSETGDDSSGLGFLTILNDYGAVLAWKFTGGPQEKDAATAVTTLVQLPV